MAKPSYFHIQETSGDEVKNVVTCAYSLNFNTGVLRYGATIFKKEWNTEHWNKRAHRERAMERYNNNPVLIELCSSIILAPNFHVYRRIEHFIRHICLPRFGVQFDSNRDF